MNESEKLKLCRTVRVIARGNKGLAVNASDLFKETFGREPTRQQTLIVAAELRFLAKGRRVIEGRTFYLL